MSDSETRNDQLVREFFVALSTGDLEALRGCCTPTAAGR